MAFYNPAQGQPQGQYPAPIMYLAAPAMPYQAQATISYGPHYARKASIGLGWTHIVLASISFVAGIIAILYDAEGFQLGIGIWAAVFYLISGCLAIAAGKEPTNKRITATLVFSIFDIICGVIQLTFATGGVLEDINCYPYSYYYDCFDDNSEGAIAANSMMIGVGSFEIIFGITLMAISARAIDIGSRAQVLSVPVYFTPNMQETVQVNPTTSENVTYPPTPKTSDAVQRTQETNEEHLYETLHHNNYEHMKF